MARRELEAAKPKKYVVRFSGMGIVEAKDEEEAKKLILKKSVPKCISVTEIEEFKGVKSNGEF